MLTPPEITKHTIKLLAQAIRQPKATHRVAWNCLCHRLDQQLSTPHG
jgi:hypothetical protein